MLKTISLRCGIKVHPGVVPKLFRHSYAATDSDEERLPRITCPKKLKEQFEKRQRKNGWRTINSRSKGQLIVSCKRKDYNFRQGEKFNSFDVQKLVSCGWKTQKRVGDYFTLVPHSENPSIESGDDAKSFNELGINERLCEGLQDLGFESPTAIQNIAIPSLLRGDNAICAAETGSGKTLAYLLPAVEWVYQQKSAWDYSRKMGHISTFSNINKPNTVIITPNRELTHQVMSVAETLQPYADFMPFALSGGQNIMRGAHAMDVLVTTPGMLLKFLTAKQIHRTNLQHLVIDESDTLLDDSFISDLITIFRLFQVNAAEVVNSRIPYLGGTQIVFFSATMPRNVEHALGDILPVDSMNRISTKGLHRLQPHVSQKFIRVKPTCKPEQLIQLVKEKKVPTLVFTKNNKTCYFLSKLFEQNGINCLRLSGGMYDEERAGVFHKFKEGYSDILVATDIASRGLDTTNVQHVINYDFPTFMSDYIHRVGRVGRVGVKHAGEVTSFITYKWDVDLVWKIETAARSRQKLDSVNANIKKLLGDSKSKNDEFEFKI